MQPGGDDSNLHKEVIPPDADIALAKMKNRIDSLQWVYAILFGTSLIVLLLNFKGGMPSYMHLVWGLSLAGAVVTRLTRQSLVNKYNARLAGGGPAPLS